MNVPALRFKEFSEYDVHKNAFKTFLIKDIANIQVGRDLKEESFSNTQTIEHGYPVYSNTVENRGLYGFYNFEEYDGNSLTVVGRGAGLGTAFARSSGFGAIGRLLVISPKNNEFNVHYFAEYVNFKLQIHNESGGIPQLPGSTFGMYSIALPSFAEQTKIANFLAAVDEKITQLTQKSDLLAQYKKGVMQKIFSQELRFKDDDGREFPEWKEVFLGDIASFIKGKGISKADIDDEGITPCIRYGELYTEYGETIREVKSKTNIDIKNLVLSEANDVIIPASGETQIDIATASCVQLSGVALGGDLNIIKSQENGVFLSYYLNNQKKLDIAKLAQGNSVVHLYSSQLKQLNIKLPIKSEQTKIADFLTAIDDKITQTQDELAAVKQYKQGLLQQMFV